MMDIHPLCTEADYDWALAEVERYLNDRPQVGTPDGDRFIMLSGLIEACGAKHWPIDPVNGKRRPKS